jgi:trimeric autotransporter adhesin
MQRLVVRLWQVIRLVKKNAAFGTNALFSNTTASNNTAVGYQAGYSNTTGDNLAAFGRQSLYSNTTGVDNTALGDRALYSNTTGQLNTSVGMGSLYDNSTGSNNVAVGREALTNNTTADNNTAVGYQAGYSNTTGGRLTAFGYRAGYNCTATGTIQNVFVGNEAGYGNTSGTNNTYIGGSSASQMTTGSFNTVIGAFDGNQGGLDIRTSSNNVVLSDGGGNPRIAVNSSGVMFVGANFTDTAGGSQIVTNGPVTVGYPGNSALYRKMYYSSDNNFYFANGSNQGYLSSAGAWVSASDARLKKNIRNIEYGLNAVISTQPRHYERNDVDGTYIGFVAQELQAVIPEVVSGDPETQLGVDYGSLVAVAFKAIQELSAKNDALTARITALEGN